MPAAIAPIAATPIGAVATRPQKAAVSYENGLLDVRANNSSLNAILREVARTTGMKLTGSVAEQRVFGNYGPASPATVLATLLDGTGSNMLLREAADSAPAELILTARTGGPSPPTPASYNNDENTGEPSATGMGSPNMNQPPSDLQQQRFSGANPAFRQDGQRQDGQNMNAPNGVSSTAPVNSGFSNEMNPTSGTAAAAATPPNGTQPASTSNGDAKTPEQVYQLLQQLRQQAAQQQAGKQ